MSRRRWAEIRKATMREHACEVPNCKPEAYKGGHDASGGASTGLVMAVLTCGHTQVVHVTSEER
jgi:hypothetical protein